MVARAVCSRSGILGRHHNKRFTRRSGSRSRDCLQCGHRQNRKHDPGILARLSIRAISRLGTPSRPRFDRLSVHIPATAARMWRQIRRRSPGNRRDTAVRCGDGRQPRSDRNPVSRGEHPQAAQIGVRGGILIGISGPLAGAAGQLRDVPVEVWTASLRPSTTVPIGLHQQAVTPYIVVPAFWSAVVFALGGLCDASLTTC
jgi:hypothetical protein